MSDALYRFEESVGTKLHAAKLLMAALSVAQGCWRKVKPHETRQALVAAAKTVVTPLGVATPKMMLLLSSQPSA